MVVPNDDESGKTSATSRPGLWPAWVRFLAGSPAPFDEMSDGLEERSGDERRLGFVMTGQKTIDEIVRCVHDGRNVMLVGPRGTGKSYMAGNAVKQCERDP